MSVSDGKWSVALRDISAELVDKLIEATEDGQIEWHSVEEDNFELEIGRYYITCSLPCITVTFKNGNCLLRILDRNMVYELYSCIAVCRCTIGISDLVQTMTKVKLGC